MAGLRETAFFTAALVALATFLGTFASFTDLAAFSFGFVLGAAFFEDVVVAVLGAVRTVMARGM